MVCQVPSPSGSGTTDVVPEGEGGGGRSGHKLRPPVATGGGFCDRTTCVARTTLVRFRRSVSPRTSGQKKSYPSRHLYTAHTRRPGGADRPGDSKDGVRGPDGEQPSRAWVSPRRCAPATLHTSCACGVHGPRFSRNSHRRNRHGKGHRPEATRSSGQSQRLRHNVWRRRRPQNRHPARDSAAAPLR